MTKTAQRRSLGRGLELSNLLRNEAIHGRALDDEASLPTRTPPEKCAEQLREREPVFRLVRDWCGQTGVDRFDEVVALRAEVQRLKGLVIRATEHLDAAGRPQIASRLRKEADGKRK